MDKPKLRELWRLLDSQSMNFGDYDSNEAVDKAITNLKDAICELIGEELES